MQVRQKLTQWLNNKRQLNQQCNDLKNKLKQMTNELEELRSVYNRLEFDENSIDESKQLLKLVGNERIDRIVRYLEKFKFELVKDIAKVTTDILYIRMRDGWVQTLETVIRHLKESKSKDSFVNKVTWEVEQLKK